MLLLGDVVGRSRVAKVGLGMVATDDRGTTAPARVTGPVRAAQSGERGPYSRSAADRQPPDARSLARSPVSAAAARSSDTTAPVANSTAVTPVGRPLVHHCTPGRPQRRLRFLLRFGWFRGPVWVGRSAVAVATVTAPDATAVCGRRAIPVGALLATADSTRRDPLGERLHRRLTLLELGQHRCRDEDRGVGADGDPDEQRQREVLQRAGTEDVRAHEQEGQQPGAARRSRC